MRIFIVAAGIISCLTYVTTNMTGMTYRIEAESAASDAPYPGEAKNWEMSNLAGASGGKVLKLAAGNDMIESNYIPLSIPEAGSYRIWIRYIKENDAACTFNIVIRDEDGEALTAPYCDLVSNMQTSRPWETASKSKHTAGTIWESFTFTAERPMNATLSFKGRIHGGGHGPRQLDCLLLTGDPEFNPVGQSLQALENIPAVQPPLATSKADGNFKFTSHPFPTTSLFSILKTEEQYMLGIIHCGGVLTDLASSVRLGFNRDHRGGRNRYTKKYGIKTLYPLESFEENNHDFAKRHPKPEGKFINSEGTAGKIFSYEYQPFSSKIPEFLTAKYENAKKLPDSDFIIEGWRLCGEHGGRMDYSSYAQAEFRNWLKAKHKSIDQLNKCWNSSYSSFEEIVPPPRFADNKPCWLEFRDFSGRKFTEIVTSQIPILDKLDSKKFLRLTQNSNLDLLSPYFKNMRPVDLEQFWTEGFKGYEYACWDTYCADDFLGSEIDLVRSLDKTKRPLNQEWGVHTFDSRIAARSFWNFICKGSAGLHVFQAYSDAAHPRNGCWQKWAMSGSDLVPYERLGAYSDAAQEVHRIEPLLAKSTLTMAVKPVALYYSQLDLSIAAPFLSLWGHVTDEPVRIYEALRGSGYLVRWITPKQIEAGDLEEIGALIMADAQYVPEAASKKIADWVKSGGTVIADRWPGAWNEYGQPQNTLSELFGIKAAATENPTAGKMAVESSVQGYGEVTVDALDGKGNGENVGELFHQWDATHPVAKEMGNFFLSGKDLKKITCVSGDVIGMSYRGTPGIVVNTYGKGKTMYSAMMLGSLYDSAGTPYEWDSTHSGDSLERLLSAFLRYAGVAPASVAHIDNPHIRNKIRIEAPLITPDGNVLIGLINYNNTPTGPFALEVELPAAAREINMVLASIAGSRKLVQLPARMEGSRLKLEMPGYDTFAMIIALKEAGPIVALDVQGEKRGAAGLLKVHPGTELDVKATVYNPSGHKLKGGSLEIILPRGWTVDSPDKKIEDIQPWSGNSVSFKVRPPAVNGGSRLKPILVHYEKDKALATEMVWWQK